MLEAHIDDTEEEDNTQEQLDFKKSELERLNRKLDSYIEMRSEGELSRETFRSKSAEVEVKMDQLRAEIAELESRDIPKPITDYREKLTVLQYALEQYTHCDEGQDVPESVIEAFVVKIVASAEGFDWYLRFDGDPDKPLHCQIEGKRKTTAKIMVSGVNSPTMDIRATGCSEGLIPVIKTIPGSKEPGIFAAGGRENKSLTSRGGAIIL